MAVGILGSGAWGTTLAKLFSINNDVILYVRNREQADQIIKTNENQY